MKSTGSLKNTIQDRKKRNIYRERKGDEGQTLWLSAQSAGIKY